MDAGTLELVELDHLLDHDCACEFRHSRMVDWCPDCTGTVVARAVACIGSRLVCQAVADFYAEVMTIPYATCQERHEPCSTHWKIFPA